jgi:electron transfer flavoprotein alpha subunit
MMSKVLIFNEIYENDFDSSVLEMISMLSDLNIDSKDIIVAALGDDLYSKESILQNIPVGKVVGYKNIDTNQFNPNILMKLATGIIDQLLPEKIIIPKTSVGQDLAPRLAFKHKYGIVNDCLSIEDNDNHWIGVRPVFGGNYLAKVKIKSDKQIFCVRTKVFDEFDEQNINPSIEFFEYEHTIETNTQIIERIQEQADGIRLEDADIVVAGGRGLGGPEPFDTLEEIAKLLNAAVGASRAVCDSGWKDHSYQIGLTGKDISPNLYFTVGISGASQHMAGCGNSKHIVSIDKNIDANIFKDAEIGAVGDWKNILPGFLDTLKDLAKN